MSKKELSYAYWHNQGGGDAPLVEPQARMHLSFTHVRLRSPPLAQQRLTEEQLASLPVSRPVGQASVWNSVRGAVEIRDRGGSLLLTARGLNIDRICPRPARGRSATGQRGRRRD